MHTPGPWEVSGFPKSEGFSILTGKGRCVAERYPAAVSEKEGEEMEANARLIAAAPELLEACKKALMVITSIKEVLKSDGMPSMLKIEKEIQQAISKAEAAHD